MGLVYGVIGIDSPVAASIVDWAGLQSDGPEATENVAIAAQAYDPTRGPLHTASDADSDCWVIGDVYGYHTGKGVQPTNYETRPRTTNPAEYARILYEKHGIEFVSRVNGNCAILIYDNRTSEFFLCTDRFGTIPLYWTRTDDDVLVFSTSIQTLPYHPDLDIEFHLAFLHEYLAFRCAFGVRTPYKGIRKHQPGSVTRISLNTGDATTTQYWRPQYRPRDLSFKWFVDEFTKRFQTVLDEWIDADRNYGVLLSGGSDSRLVLAGARRAGADMTAFHMNDWMNREAQTAERVAITADVDFVMLQRGAQYRIEAIERNKCAQDFGGWFTQPYTSGYQDQIVGRVDGLLSGLYGDSLYREYSVPSSKISLGRPGSITPPIERRIDTIDDYIDFLLDRASDGHDLSTDLHAILTENIYRDGGEIIHHGVAYDSLDELVYYGGCYPLTNDDDMRFHTGLSQLLPYRSPYLDNRLLDLALTLPVRYRLRRNIIDRAIEQIAPSLARIPHANTGVRLSRPFWIKYAGRHLVEARYKYCPKHDPPKPYFTHGPWLDDAELLRSHQFAHDVITEKQELLDAIPGLSSENVRRMYHEHCRGENHVSELYTLLTLLTMPATEHILKTETDELTEEATVNSSRVLFNRS